MLRVKGGLERARASLDTKRAGRTNRRQIDRVEEYLIQRGRSKPEVGHPVAFFNASTRIHHLSQNSAFELVAAWAVRMAGVPAVQLVCDRGMHQCMLGTRRESLSTPPPCPGCLRTSHLLYGASHAEWLPLERALANRLEQEIEAASLSDLAGWSHNGLPLGELCLPSLRWAMRRHHLADDPATRFVFRQYLVSAASLAVRLTSAMDRLEPRCLVVFNGITFPEAVARAIARRQGIPVVTHEVGLRPHSAFFSHEDATFRALALPPDLHLTGAEEQQLDAVLERRFKGLFSMAGVSFWPEIRPVPDWLQEKLSAHRRVVTVFSNVIFDTSQVHANTIFDDMFEWLASLREVFARHPEVLFILRAHPDEDRPGKESSESVADWVRESGVLAFGNVVFLEPGVGISSYELMARSKLILVYNSSIGLEASLAGRPVLCAGRARYTQAETVFFPEDRERYAAMLEGLLSADIAVPANFHQNARRYFYHEFFRASLGFEAFMEDLPIAPGNVVLSEFEPGSLERSREVSVLQQGILEGAPFVLPAVDGDR